MTSVPTQQTATRGLDPRARAAARLFAVQALYQMDIAATPLDEVVEEFVEHRLEEPEGDNEIFAADKVHFEDVVRGVVREQRELDVQVNSALAKGWSLARLDATLRAILRCGTYELRRCKDVPLKVVINEYVEIAHAFFEGDEPGVVNAVLDRLGRDIRAGSGIGHGSSEQA
ncbi:NusB antitermination factor [Parvibaculum lavamentivorans DS-1]|uniref:Transcription antitermination protein NusB n=1 Tax=Parvibaculum lavamentivorans (strain DS-1 / DSM 13023 / NCIMB 13966) TaxID=402881 RepID=A7HX88_PARL1|nr:transcription antitermination factor NusB [Parvibaculum lavamentivorans]ABS64521.1 NusB antitermination factor [Parvibaculum lavamentivorans DS-1]